jgi:hypothetical protein
LGYGRERGDKGKLFPCTGHLYTSLRTAKQIFTFADSALEQVNSMNKKGRKRVTACEFLNMLKIFRVVILQDAVELIGIGSGGHAVFRHTVFQSHLFIEWVKSFRVGLKVNHPDQTWHFTIWPLIKLKR